MSVDGFAGGVDAASGGDTTAPVEQEIPPGPLQPPAAPTLTLAAQTHHWLGRSGLQVVLRHGAFPPRAV